MSTFAICLPSVFCASGRTMTLPWKTPRASSASTPLNSSRLVQPGHRVIDDERRVDVLVALRQEGAGEIELAALGP